MYLLHQGRRLSLLLHAILAMSHRTASPYLALLRRWTHHRTLNKHHPTGVSSAGCRLFGPLVPAVSGVHAGARQVVLGRTQGQD